MMKKLFQNILIIIYFFLGFFTSIVYGNNFVTIHNQSVLLNNGFIEREITFRDGNIQTTYLKIKDSDINFSSESAEEFSLSINNNFINGQTNWELISITKTADHHQGSGAKIKLRGTKEFSGIEIDLVYLLYPELPVIRKRIDIINNSGNEILIESLDIEKLILEFHFVNSVTYTNYARQKHLGTYIGNWDDAVVAIHSYTHNAGILLGNESPGVLKRTAYNTEYNNFEIGLTHKADDYPFRKYIRNGDNWESPSVFIIPYIDSPDPTQAKNTHLADFVRKHLGLRIFQVQKKRPQIMYNHWVPFRDKINDTIIMELAKVAKEVGITNLTIDAGWFSTKGNLGKSKSWHQNLGDYIEDYRKFPNELKPVFNEVYKLGIYPGLWIGVGAASKTSDILQNHPEWTIRDESGNIKNLHLPDPKIDQWSMCLGTEWTEYIKKKILELVRNFGLTYVKLDLSVVTSAYVTDSKNAGCSATNHPYHKDREESLIVIYERLFQLFDDLHEEVPDLFIDCTFETTGKLQLIDFAFCQHAEGNWLTNIYEPFPIGALRVRNLAWWKSSVIPATAMIIGNLPIDNIDYIKNFQSLIGSFPIVLGDIRQLSEDQKNELRKWTDWIKKMKNKYQYDFYRQDLPGFGEPMEGAWDGWLRINTDTKAGGIIGVFKQGSVDNERTISIRGLDKKSSYRVSLAPLNEEVVIITGKDLEEKGFKVEMKDKYDSRLYEIERLDYKEL